MSVTIDIESILQNPTDFMIKKNIQQTRNRMELSQIDKLYLKSKNRKQNPTANTILNSEILYVFSLRSGTRQGFSSPSVQQCTRGLSYGR